ncbi:vancomycin high temperature exclusion protein [Haloferula helveola]|uniref:Vancomycin high temperature exclusion protein n=1 Tax=Haloferula helveola TaxID=490095 RepID=A0ABN6HA12_9BACT|nr:vancomycin high temperature exclusion protein [Haloferula helveola]
MAAKIHWKRCSVRAGAVLFLFVFIALALLVSSGLNDKIGHADVALVLGNKVSPDGEPSPRLKARLDKAVELYREGWFPLILVSGGTGKEGYPEGTAMKRYLVASGIPEAAVVVDDDGVDIWASATHTARLIKERELESVFVISQFYHVPRSRLALSKFGIEPVYTAHASFFEPRDVYSTLRELPAYLKYLFFKTAEEGS